LTVLTTIKSWQFLKHFLAFFPKNMRSKIGGTTDKFTGFKLAFLLAKELELMEKCQTIYLYLDGNVAGKKHCIEPSKG
jgi:hypothetical protein